MLVSILYPFVCTLVAVQLALIAFNISGYRYTWVPIHYSVLARSTLLWAVSLFVSFVSLALIVDDINKWLGLFFVGVFTVHHGWLTWYLKKYKEI